MGKKKLKVREATPERRAWAWLLFFFFPPFLGLLLLLLLSGLWRRLVRNF